MKEEAQPMLMLEREIEEFNDFIYNMELNDIMLNQKTFVS